jgi:hypothetical protein
MTRKQEIFDRDVNFKEMLFSRDELVCCGIRRAYVWGGGERGVSHHIRKKTFAGQSARTGLSPVSCS